MWLWLLTLKDYIIKWCILALSIWLKQTWLKSLASISCTNLRVLDLLWHLEKIKCTALSCTFTRHMTWYGFFKCFLVRLSQPKYSCYPRPSLLLWSLKTIHNSFWVMKVFTDFHIWCNQTWFSPKLNELEPLSIITENLKLTSWKLDCGQTNRTDYKLPLWFQWTQDWPADRVYCTVCTRPPATNTLYREIAFALTHWTIVQTVVEYQSSGWAVK